MNEALPTTNPRKARKSGRRRRRSHEGYGLNKISWPSFPDRERARARAVASFWNGEDARRGRWKKKEAEGFYIIIYIHTPGWASELQSTEAREHAGEENEKGATDGNIMRARDATHAAHRRPPRFEKFRARACDACRVRPFFLSLSV